MTTADKFGIALSIGITIVLVAIAMGSSSVNKTTQAPIVTQPVPVSTPVPAPAEETMAEPETAEETMAEPETAEETMAEPETVNVSIPKGTSTPGCEATEECFMPNTAEISVGGTVIWTNNDSAAHTVTSGMAASGPDGIFDSSIFMSGKTFEHTFDEAGSFDYFCLVHPWMTGNVLVT